MSRFDVDAYFNNRFQNTVNTPDSKAEALLEAKQKKIDSLTALHNSNVEREALNKDSWVNRLELSPGTIKANAVNTAASLASGANRFVGHLHELPYGLAAAGNEMYLTPEDVEAYSRYQYDQRFTEEERARPDFTPHATPEDIERLNSPVENFQQDGFFAPNYFARGIGPEGAKGPSRLEIIESALENQKQVKRIRDLVEDDARIVHQDNRMGLSQDLGDGFDEKWESTKSGWFNLMDGRIGEGASQLASGMAGLIANIGDAAINNKAAVTEYVAENLPQLVGGLAGRAGRSLVSSSNIGYAVDNYYKGIEEYRLKHGGQYPPAEERQKMATYAASLALAEQVGDVTLLRSLRDSGEILKGAPKTGIVRSTKNTAKTTASSSLTEGATEGWQTFAEGEIQGKTTSARDRYEGAAIGGLTGGTITGGARGVAELVGATPEQQKAKAVEAQDKAQKQSSFTEAVKANDPSRYLDKESKDYDPLAGIKVLHTSAKNNGLDETTKQANLEQVEQITDSMDAEVRKVQTALDMLKPENLKDNIQSLTEQKNQATDEQTKKTLDDQIAAYQRLLDNPDKTQQRTYEAQLAKLEREYQEATRLRDDLVKFTQGTATPQEVQALVSEVNAPMSEGSPDIATTTAPKVERLMTLSMASPDAITVEMAEQLANNTQNSLTESQRAYFRTFSKARQAENALKTGSDVQQDIYFGRPATKKNREQVGLAKYRERVGKELAAGNEKKASEHLSKLQNFAQSHTAKAAAVKQAYQQARASGSQAPIGVLRKGDSNDWELVRREVSEQERAERGGVNVHMGSAQLVEDIETEAEAINATLAELEAASALRFAKQDAPQTTQGETTDGTDTDSGRDNRPARTARSDMDDVEVLNETTEVPEAPSINKTTESVEGAESTAVDSVDSIVTTTPRPPSEGATVAEGNEVSQPDLDDFAQKQRMADIHYASRNGWGREQVQQVRDQFNDGLTVSVIDGFGNFFYKDPEGKDLSGAFNYFPNTGVLSDLDIRSLTNKPGTSDFATLRKMVKELSSQLPGLKEVAAQRVSGARTRAAENLRFAVENGRMKLVERSPVATSTVTPEQARAMDDAQLNAALEPLVELGDRRTPEQEATFRVLDAEMSAREDRTAAALEEPTNSTTDVVEREAANQAPQTEAGTAEAQSDLAGTSPEPQGILGVMAQRAAPEVPYTERNLVADLDQVPGKAGDASMRPLVMVKDFFSQVASGVVNVADYLAQKTPLTQEQQNAMITFWQLAKDWNQRITDNLVKRNRPEFYHEDFMQFLITETDQGRADVEENVKTAISAAIYSWIAENSTQPPVNDKQAINAMLGRDEDAQVPFELQNALAEAGVRQQLIVNALGQRVVAALGLRNTPNTPQNVLPVLEATLGAHALRVMLDTGLVDQNVVSDQLIQKLLGEGNVPDTHVEHYFIRLVQSGEGKAVIDQIAQNNAGSQSILNKLFGVEAEVSEPSLEATKFTQKTTKNTKQGIPGFLRKLMGKKNAKPHYVLQTKYELLNQFDRNELLEMTGFVEDLKSIHTAKRKSQEAKNLALQKEWDNYFGFVENTILKAKDTWQQAIFFTHSVWKQQRVGVSTSTLNPQQSKLHRYLVHQKDWETEIDLNDEASYNNYLLRVAEGFGLKTDRNSSDAVLAEIKEILALPMIQEAVDALAKEGAALTVDEKQIIKDAIRFGKQELHTLDALMGLAQEAKAKANKQTTFTVQMLGEIDGVTNGPILSHLMLGAAHSVSGLMNVLNRGGIYEQGNEHTQYNFWQHSGGKRDIYQDTVASIAKQIHEALSTQRADGKYAKSVVAIWGITGAWFDPTTDTVTGTGRDVIKKPIQAISFGAGVGSTVSDMADAFIETVYDKIEEYAATGSSPQPLIESLNQILQAEGVAPIHPNLPIERLMERTFTDRETQAIKRAFKDTIGESVKAVITDNFATYIQARTELNTTAQRTFDLYNAAYQAVRTEYMKEIGIPMKKGEPLYDLSQAQEAELQKRLKSMAPVMHSPLSKQDGDKRAGLRIAKNEREFGRSAAYSGKANFATPATRGAKTKSMTVRAFQQTERNPGVAMLPISTHAGDSAISHMTQAEVSALNLHDALGVGVGLFSQTANTLNKSTWQVLLDYSPLNEAYDAMVSVVLGVHELMTDPNTPEAVKASIVAEIKRQAIKAEIDPDVYVSTLIGQSKTNAVRADRLKYQTMKELASIDQYALEGGNYEVTDADRAEAAKREAKLVTEVAPSVWQKAGEIDAIVKAGVEIKSAAPQVQEDAQHIDPVDELNSGLFNHSTARILSLVDYLLAEESVGKEDKTKLNKVRKELGRGKSLRDAVIASLELTDRGTFMQLLSSHYDSIPENFWGELGEPTIASDERLVQVFEQRGNLTAEQAINLLAQTLSSPFDQKLLRAVKRLVNPKLTVRYVTPSTAARQVLNKPVSAARGWYATKGDQEAIYVLSPDFVHSGLTPELLLHELVHGALAQTIAAELDAKAQDASYTSDALELVQELEALMAEAKAYATDHKISGFTDALNDVQEFVAWGMTNRDFQAKVLSQFETKTKTKGNALVKAMRKFIDNLSALLFKNPQASDTKALAVLVSNVSGLMAEAANRPKARDLIQSMASVPGLDAVRSYTTQELFEGLGRSQITILNPEFKLHLQEVLGNIVEKLHGPFGSLKAELMQNQPYFAQEVFIKAKDTGVMPFASAALASGFAVTPQEAFVLEQVEVTVRQAIEDSSVTTTQAYRELSKTYRDARKQLKPQDFFDGDWSTATPHQQQEAQALYDFIFDMNGGHGDRSDYLSRFAAMGIANQRFNQILQDVSESVQDAPTQRTLAQRIRDAFDTILGWFSEKYLHTPKGQRYDRKLVTLVDHLAQIEAKKQASLSRKQSDILNTAEEAFSNLSEKAREQVAKVAGSAVFKKSSSPFVRAAGSTTSVIAKDRLDLMLEGVQRIRDEHIKEQPGVIMGILNDLKGADVLFQALHRASKRLNQRRQDIKENVAKFSLNSFANEGKDLTDEHKASISNVFLRSGMSKLLDSFDIAQIHTLMTDKAARDRAIMRHDRVLRKYPKYWSIFNTQIKALAYARVTGRSTIPDLLLNTDNIATMVGYSTQGVLSASEHAEVKAALDVLLPLYAMGYAKETATAAQVLKTELDRQDNGNGVEFVLRLHKHLLEDSKQKLFDGSEALITDGYVPEIYNPHIDVRVATDNPLMDAQGNVLRDGDGTTLQYKGYVRGGVVPKDAVDPDTDTRRLYILKDGGLRPWVAGIISNKGMFAKGSTKQPGKTLDAALEAPYHAKTIRDIKDRNAKRKQQSNPDFDPTKVNETFMVPLLNGNREIVNYRYMMRDSVKDAVLERDNRFEIILGTLASSTFDKETSPEHNRKAIQAMHDFYKEDFTDRSISYRMVGPRSDDPELRAIYEMFPQETKDAIKAIWGTDHMMIRTDLLDISFGYRKLSLSTIFEKDSKDRAFLEKMAGGLVEAMLTSYAKVRLGMDDERANKYAMRAGVVVRRAEDVWQNIVGVIKDIIVVRSGVVLVDNILSNFTALMIHGLNPMEMVKSHKEALKGALAYQNDSRELERIQTVLDIGYGRGDEAELQREAARLKDALARNPVAKLIDAGLMPTIVEDVSISNDPYSYKSRFVRKTEQFTDKLNPRVVSAANTLLLNRGTAGHNFLSQTTQLSDFVARYALYQHLTTRKKNPLTHDQAVQKASDTFINYDIPMHRKLQYLDDNGFFMFTKYLLRVQRVIVGMMKDNPARALMTLTLSNYFDGVPTIIDSSLIHRHQIIPFRAGAFEGFNVVDDLATVQAGLSLFR